MSSEENVTDQIAELLSDEPETGEADELRETTQADEEKNAVDASEEDSGSEEEGDREESDGGEVRDESAEGENEKTSDSWLDVLGIDEDKLSFEENGNIKGVNIKVNGEQSTVPMEDLIAGYQTNKSVTQKSQALAEERKSFDSEKETVTQVYKSKLKDVEALSKHFEDQLVSEYNNINWEKLRVDDPAEYAAARQDYASKAQEMQRIKDAIDTDKRTSDEYLTKEHQQVQQAHLKGQFDKMIENNPSWHDESVRKTDMDSYKTFMNDSYGFTSDDMNNITDARIIEVIKDARKYREGTKIASKKINRPVPKFQKSRGKANKAKASKLDKLTSASRKAQGSEKRDLQKSAIAELLMNG